MSNMDSQDTLALFSDNVQSLTASEIKKKSDIVYVCNNYIVTPFKNISFSKKDHFNFYYS